MKGSDCGRPRFFNQEAPEQLTAFVDAPKALHEVSRLNGDRFFGKRVADTVVELHGLGGRRPAGRALLSGQRLADAALGLRQPVEPIAGRRFVCRDARSSLATEQNQTSPLIT